MTGKTEQGRDRVGGRDAVPLLGLAILEQMTAAEITMTPQEEILQRLNEEYVHASLAGDVEWFRAHLADEFVCTESDGSVRFKDAFPRMIAKDADLAEYRLDYVDVRFYSGVALVRPSGSWVTRNGVAGVCRYIDVYARTGDEWKVVSAQVTRPGHA